MPALTMLDYALNVAHQEIDTTSARDELAALRATVEEQRKQLEQARGALMHIKSKIDAGIDRHFHTTPEVFFKMWATCTCHLTANEYNAWLAANTAPEQKA